MRPTLFSIVKTGLAIQAQIFFNEIMRTKLSAFNYNLPKEQVAQYPSKERDEARLMVLHRKTGKIALSIKALEIAEEKEAVAAYGSSDSGASLGDILGAALKDREKR